MSTLGALALTYADWAKRDGGNGTIAEIIELLSQTNEIVEDMLVLEANGATSHQTSVRTGLPQAYWRLMNAGVQIGKSTTAKITDNMGMLETYSIIDKALADLNGNTAAFRLSEDIAFLEGMTQQMAKTIFYGNGAVNPEQFMGLSPRYQTVQPTVAANAVNVVDCGGTGSTNTSMWALTWGPRTLHGIFPKGGRSGFQMKDKGDQQTQIDANGGRFEAYTTHFKWDNGLTLRDWRYVVRMCNIDVTALGGGAAPNLITALIRAVHRLPTVAATVASVQKTDAPNGGQANNGRLGVYVNRTISTYLDIQALNRTNMYLTFDLWDGKPITKFRGVPIRTCDQLLNTEARVV